MKFKIQAGGTIDVATRQEVKEEIAAARASWVSEVAIGSRYSRLSASAAVSGGNVLLGGPERESDKLGPAPGMVWDVRRVRIDGLVDGDVVYLYTNEEAPSQLIASTADVTGALFLFAEQVVLYPGDALLIAGTSLDGTTITVTGMARELPESLAWRLGG